MCECGCTMNDDKYTFPGPGKSYYLLTLSGECKSCDAPPGVTLELIEPGASLYAEYKRGDFNTEQLKLEKWPDSKGVAFITGMRSHEFVKSVLRHLEGLEVKHFVENGRIDRIGAETILEEMYDDSQVRPYVVSPVNAGTSVSEKPE